MLKCFFLTLGLLYSGAVSAQGEHFAGLRLAHLSPDAPLIDMLIDGELVLRDIEFSAISSYLYIEPGQHELKVFPHRAPGQQGIIPTLDAPSEAEETQKAEPVRPLEPFTISVDVETDRYYTVTLLGYFNPPAAQDEVGSLDIELDEAQSISVQVQGPRGYLVSLDQSQTLDGLEPGTYTVSASGEGLRPAEYELELEPGEATTLPINLQQGETAETPRVVTSAGRSQDLGEPVWHRSQLQIYEDALRFPPAGYAYLRVVHAAPGIAAVDLISTELPTPRTDSAEQSTLLSGLAFPNASAYIIIPLDVQDFELRLAGTDFGLATYNGVQLAAGALYTLYLTGNLSEQSLTLLPGIDAVLRAAPGE